MREKEPADYAANDVASRKRYVEVEGLNFSEACHFEKLHRISQYSISAQYLRSPYDAVLRSLSAPGAPCRGLLCTYNLCSTKVNALKTLPERGVLALGIF